MKAIIGDIHGCLVELKELYKALKSLGIADIWCTGDLVDRGPDSASVIRFCIENNIHSVRGNHDDSICNHYRNYKLTGRLPTNRDKLATLKNIDSSVDSEELYKWLDSLPHLRVFDNENLILAHGGLWPELPLHKQPNNIIRVQMVHPKFPGATRWWGSDAHLSKPYRSEAEHIKEGWQRWYKVYDHEQNIIFGHSTFNQPFTHQNPGYGMTIGVDTGTSFGGSLTACIYEKDSPPFFISVKNKKVYCQDTYRSFWEE